MNNQAIVWNLTTRILHWLIAIPVIINFFLDGGDLSHKVLGYVALGALVARLIWGLKAKDHSQLKSFPLSASHLKGHFSAILKKETDHYPGHNPLGSLVYVCIWVIVAALGITGWMMGLDAFWGEEWLEETHEVLATGLGGLVALHFLGLIFDSIKYKRKTWLGMITGKRN